MKLLTINLIALISLSCSTTSSKKDDVDKTSEITEVTSPTFKGKTETVNAKCESVQKPILVTDIDVDKMIGVTDHLRFNKGKKYYLNFVQTDIRDALTELSVQSGLPISIDEQLSGMVTLEIKGERFLDALKLILSTGPFDYKFSGKYFYVGLIDQNSNSWLKLSHSYRYKLLNIKASTVAALINPVYKKSITVDDALGVISIYAPRSILKEVVQIISNVDRKAKQVLLTLSITELSDKDNNGFGRYQGGMGTAFGVANSLNPIQPAFEQAVLTKDAYKAFLNSIIILNKEGKAEIKAQPKLIVQDGETAEFKSQMKTLLGGENQLSLSRMNFLETGVALNLIPSIVNDNEILLTVLEAKSGSFEMNESDKINEHFIKTKVRVKSGETLLLGGMMSKKKYVSVSKVPLLGDIPYLGWLFKSESTLEKDVEVIFTITPEILCE